MLQVFSFDEKSWVHMHYAAMRQSGKIPFFARSLRFLKIWTINTQIIFIFSSLGNMLHSNTPLIVDIIYQVLGFRSNR